MNDLGPLPKESDYSLKQRKASIEIRDALFDLRKRLGLTSTQYLSILAEEIDLTLRHSMRQEQRQE